jgi:ATP-dependent helicase HrpB
MAGGARGGRGTPEGRPPLGPLPIDAVLPQLVAALRDRPAAVLRAPTGAGKTTRVPPALLDAGLADLSGRAGQVVVLEPRRVAARAAARRMAEERGCALGDEVGYRLRLEQAAGPRTRILVVTEGLLVRMLQTDPFLERVGAVVFDEFHERSLDTDLALAMVRKVQREVRPELRLVVMSATIAAREIAAWLGDAPVIESEGRLFPVAIEHLEREPERTARLADGLDARVADGVRHVFTATDGDVLAFLPGVGEIRAARAALEPWAARSGVALCELYGDLSSAEQDRALRRAPGGSGRRGVLATKVAETSVTVEGVTGVVD